MSGKAQFSLWALSLCNGLLLLMTTGARAVTTEAPIISTPSPTPPCGQPMNPTVITGPDTGIIRSPNYPSQYPPNSNCHWLFVAASVQAVTVRFNDLCTESCCDIVRMYDGNTTSSPQIAQHQGCFVPTAPVTSSGNSMLVVFTSDGSIQERGFELSWTFAIPPCPPNFVHLGSSCYYFLLSRMSWWDAEKYCTLFDLDRFRVHLVGLETETEYETLRNYIYGEGNLAGRSFWVSGSIIDRDRGWAWASSSTAISYNRWAPGEPSGNGDCIQMWHERSLLWDDTSCDSQDIHAICEVAAES